MNIGTTGTGADIRMAILATIITKAAVLRIEMMGDPTMRGAIVPLGIEYAASLECLHTIEQCTVYDIVDLRCITTTISVSCFRQYIPHVWTVLYYQCTHTTTVVSNLIHY